MKLLQFRLIDASGKIVGYERWSETHGWVYSTEGVGFRPTQAIPHIKKDPWTLAMDQNKALVYENDIMQWSASGVSEILAVVTYTDYLTAFELRNDALKIRCGVGLMVNKTAHRAPVIVGNMHEQRYAELREKIKLYGGLPK